MASYPALSGLMSDHAEVFAIRAFSKLHARDLLYYQAELAELEMELEEVEQADFDTPARRPLCQHWKSLTGTGVSSLIVGNDETCQKTGKNLQWSLMLRIRRTLKEYGEQDRLQMLSSSYLF
jgi:hypothetical protein